MNDLARKAFGGLLRLVVTLAALLFVPAWTLQYWQAWLFLFVFSGSVVAITIYLLQHDPQLLERRLAAGPGAEKEKSQKIIQLLAAIAFNAVIIVPAIDHRLGWSSVPAYVTALGDLVVVLGLCIVFVVFRANSFASSVIEVGAEQRVISTGPYAIVRHPMYIGALIMLLGVPLSLGSWWGLLTIIPMALVIIWRLLDEERYLAQKLSGYSAYQELVRFRLVPFIP